MRFFLILIICLTCFSAFPAFVRNVCKFDLPDVFESVFTLYSFPVMSLNRYLFLRFTLLTSSLNFLFTYMVQSFVQRFVNKYMLLQTEPVCV